MKQNMIRLVAVLSGLTTGLAAGVASSATMTQLIDEPSDIRVAPFVQASWAQGSVGDSPCYNSKTPNNYLSGCVATAAGQIMRKWQYPAAAPVRVTNADCKIDGVATSRTMIGGPDMPYAWADMPLVPANEASLSAEQREAIGTLLHDIGVAVGMNWRNDGSSTSTSILVEQFTSTFGYANAAIVGNPAGTGLSLEQFKKAVLPSLDAGLPVVVGIGGANTSHSVVCDGYGYDEDGGLCIHLNMGNAVDSDTPVDYNNTWYRFPTNNPEANDVSLWSGGEQSYLNPVVYNISPTMQKGWSVVSGRILSGGIAVKGAEVVAVNASGEGVARATSNEKGIYALALPAGVYTLRAVGSDETKGARVPVTVVATEGTRDGVTATGVVVGNQYGVDIALADIGSDFLADETPDAYIDYVETDGTAYIDTGVIGKAGTKADIDMAWGQFTSGSDNSFLGSRNGTAGRFILCHVYRQKWNLGYSGDYRNDVAASPAPAVGARYRVQSEITSAGMYNFTVNGTAYQSDFTSFGNYDSTFSMYLFALQGQERDTAGYKSPSGTRCYATKIWQLDDGGAYRLVRDFAPCRKGGRAALYDKVTRTIFYSRSGTDLIASDYMISTVGQPDAYLDYVMSDGNQYVDTGVIGKSGTKVRICIEPTATTESYFLASRSGDERFLFYYIYGGKFNVGYRDRYQAQNFGAVTAGARYDLTAEIVQDGSAINVSCTENGTAKPATKTQWTTGALDTGLNLYMFALNYNGSVSGRSKTKCYATKIWQTDANGDEHLLRDFVPCRKDGVVGLYDKVSQSIFVSKGAKPLIAGAVSSVVEEPDEFLDYVESDGNQYIDTGVNGRAGTKVEMEFNANDDNGNPSYLLSSYGNSTHMNFCYFGSGLNVGFGGVSYNRYWNSYARNTKYAYGAEYSLAQGVSAWRSVANGTPDEKTDTTTGGTDSGLNLFAFARNNAGTADGYSSVKLYSMKIWQTDDGGAYKLVRDYVPCKKNGEAGLYDKVTKSIFYSRGTKPFIAGALPGYPDEILDFVESDGNQYIDTGVEGRRGVKAMMDVAWTEFTSGSYQELFGAASSAGRCNLCDIYGAKPSYSYGENYGVFNSGLTSDRTVDTVYHVNTEAAAKEVLIINGYTGVRTTASEVSENFTTGLNLYLFARNNNGSGDLRAKAKLYYVKIWLDGVLVRDFVPCKKDGVAGLWDRVSKAIFYSKGSKQLIADNSTTLAKVGRPDSFVEYVESDGTQYIDTGVIGRGGTKADIDFIKLDDGNSRCLLGSRRNASTERAFLCYFYQDTKNINWMTVGYGSDYVRTWWEYGKDTRYSLQSEFTVDGVVKAALDGTPASDKVTGEIIDTGYPLYLFAMNDNGKALESCSARCYGLKLWQTDANGDYQAKRDFTPCVKDGKAALYDSISGMIYYPQGGDLTASETEASLTARWIGGTVASVADFANADNWKCWQGGLVVYGKTPVTVSEGVATLNGSVVLDGLPKGWKVKKGADGTSQYIVKVKGMMIIAR